MLVLRTGKPGHGKTLNAIREVDQQAFKQGRPVYYHNINGLKPATLKASWFVFDDPHKWYELPANSIIVVDEAQGWFAGRDSRSRPPEYITRFEVMRHSGFEVHLITQDPRYLDVHLRRLANSHIHFWRVFKSQRLIRFESEVVVEKVEVLSSFKDADKRRAKIDPEYFDSYTSANADHHFKTKVPLKMVLALATIAFALVYGALLIYNMSTGSDVETSAPGAAVPAAAPAPTSPKEALGSLISPVSRAVQDQHVTAKRYIELRTPRIPDVPSSAPIYDELTQPVTYPKLSCVMSSDPAYIERNRQRYRVVPGPRDKSYICECFTQQGSWHKTSFGFCQAVVKNGYFDPAIPDREPLQVANPNGGIAEPAKQTASGGQTRLTIVADSSRDGRPLTPAQ